MMEFPIPSELSNIQDLSGQSCVLLEGIRIKSIGPDLKKVLAQGLMSVVGCNTTLLSTSRHMLRSSSLQGQVASDPIITLSCPCIMTIPIRNGEKSRARVAVEVSAWRAVGQLSFRFQPPRTNPRMVSLAASGRNPQPHLPTTTTMPECSQSQCQSCYQATAIDRGSVS